MSTPSVFSQAFNFPPISSSVNNRTGAVDISFPLAKITSGLQTPASFTLALTYRPGTYLSSSGFGGSWIPNTPRIEGNNGLIYLSNGAVEKYTGNYQLQYHRLQDIKIEVLRITESTPTGRGTVTYNNYVITHKNGTVEYFDEQGKITRLVSASGHYLDFTYEASNSTSSFPRLLRIQDADGNYIAIDWNDIPNQPGVQAKTVVIRQVIANETKVTKIYGSQVFGGTTVYGISLPNSETDRFRFEYTTLNGLAYIRKFTNPNGQVQTFSYGTVSYTNGVTVPVVTQVDTTGANTGDAGKITVNYEYSNNNFTGYSSGQSMQPGQDNCVLRTDEYTYDVTEKHSDIKIVRTFNRFHLLISETLSAKDQDVERRTVNFAYPLLREENINEQNANYSLWIQKESLFRDTSGRQRTISETRAFDNSGNLLSKSKNGTINVYTYYAAAGEDGCPADPNGFVRYLKTAYTASDENNPPPLKTLTLRYQAVRGLDYATPKSGTKSTMLVLTEKTTANGIEMETNGYVASSDGSADAASRPFIGMPAWTQSRSSDQMYGTSFNYSSGSGLAVVTTTYRSVAGTVTLTKAKSKVFSLSSGLTQMERDFNNAVTSYEYDVQGRLTRQANYAGTSLEQVETTTYASYQAIDGYEYQNVVTTTKPNGVQHIDYYNFNNQLSYAFERLPQATPVLLKKMQYNNVGLLESETSYDMATDINGAAKAIAITTSYLYYLRDVSRKTYADGSTESFSKNATLNQETSQRNTGAITTTAYDNAGRIVLIQVGTNSGYTNTTLAQHTYDGLGRKTQSINATGGVTQYSYDVFDRLITETIANTDGNGRVDTNTYAYSSVLQNMALPISVTSKTKKNDVEDTILSETRMYDGFGRLITQDQRNFTYANPYDERPLTSGVADAVITENLDPITSLLLSVVRSGPGDTRMNLSYIYDDTPSSTSAPPTLRLRAATSSQNSVEQTNFQYTYNDRGQVSALFSTYAGGVTASFQKTFSASGERVLTATNYLGKAQRYYYSATTGKLLIKLYDNLNIRLLGDYDTNGDLIRVKLRSPKFGPGSMILAFDMRVTYSAFGLEEKRSFNFQFVNGQVNELTGDRVLDVTNTYAANTLLQNRIVIKGGQGSAGVGQNYTYQAAYGHLATSNTTIGDASGTGAPTTMTYDFAGGQRLATVQETGKNTISYNYTNDAPLSVFDGVTTTEYNRDFLGNITEGPISDGILNFDAANSVVIRQSQQDSNTYQYAYDPFGQLSQIKDGAGDNIIYLYDEGKLISEMSGNTLDNNTRTLYLKFGDIMIGRYIARTTSSGTQEELELYGTDSTGSVRYVKRIAAGGAELSNQYFDYSDYGVRT